MWPFAIAPVAVCLLTSVMSVDRMSQNKATERPFAAGEILVTFRPGSDPGLKVARAASRGEGPSEDVAAHVSLISTELGVPLEAKRLGSGGTVLLVVRTADLSDMLAKQLRSLNYINSVQTVTPAAGAQGTVQVEFVSGTPEASEVTSAAGSEAKRTLASANLTKRLERSLGVALAGEVNSSGQFLVTPALQRLTLQVIERLNKRADVKAAQPNYRLRMMSGIALRNPIQ